MTDHNATLSYQYVNVTHMGGPRLLCQCFQTQNCLATSQFKYFCQWSWGFLTVQVDDS